MVNPTLRRRLKQRRSIPLQYVVIIGSLFIIVMYAIGLYLIVGESTQANQSIRKGNKNIQIHSNQKQDQSKENAIVKTAVATIGWAVTITGCGADPITEGAAVLKHAVHLTSIHGNQGGKYDYKMYAIYHPDGEMCALTLKDLGYELVKREAPVAVKDIEGKWLREKIEKNGCCGEKELVKLEAYTLTQHPAIVHLDLDVVVLKPMDHLFDMILSDSLENFDTSNVPIMWPEQPIPQKVNAFFTRDCKLFYELGSMSFLILS